MNTTKRQFTIYMICAFGIAWVMQVIASIFANQGDTATFSLLVTGAMLVPFLSVLIARIPLKGMGWAPRLKGKIRYVFLALWTPAVLSTLGALLFFAIFPHAFDGELETLRAALAQGGGPEGMDAPAYLLLMAGLAVTVAPFLNMALAMGEEVGWRGAMYPYLKEKLGVTRGRILGGVLWGVWHWPIIILAGYEYGKEYFGAPFLGPVVFCIFTVVLGILHDHFYDRTKCIWIPALFHGAVNAFTMSAYLLKPDCQNYMILGPLYIGLISMLPALAAAIWASARDARGEQR